MLESKTPDVSIVVPCRNEIRHIRAFLDCLFHQELGAIEVEVLIADGMSDDGTRGVLAEFETKCPSFRVMDNPERIISTGTNRAIREARGEIIVRMDVHTLYAPDYVRTCVEVLKETGAGNVGGPALTRVDGWLAKAIALAFHTPFASGGATYRDPRYEGPTASVSYGCFRKSTLDLVGLYDEELVCGQDADLNFRIASLGWTVWQSPKIISWYTPRNNLSSLCRQHFQYGFWKFRILRKHRKIFSWRSIVPSSCLLGGVALLLCALVASVSGSVTWRDVFLAVLLALVDLYFIASFAAAFFVARRHGWQLLLILPVVFAA
ncbi:MAG TPA: glycosyltransferase family 2 protein, partial [Candidatus Acidoferrales bacterium]|nr:glycosyltransferase family 2 protein [Candidatus Acidoferrales bacterium]